MATLNENAAAVKAAAQAIDAAIVAKGGTTTGGLANAAAAIASIPSGTSRPWWMDEDWPDIREIIKNDQENYPIKAIILYDAEIECDITLSGFVKYVTSDGMTYTSNSVHRFDPSRGKYGWIKWYGSVYDGRGVSFPRSLSYNAVWIHIHTTDGSRHVSVDAGNGDLCGASLKAMTCDDACKISAWFMMCHALRYVKANISILNRFACQFSNCNSLRRFDGKILYDISNLNEYGMYKNTYSIDQIQPIVGIENFTNVSNFFNSSYAKRFNMETLNLASATVLTNVFGGMKALVELPKLIVNMSVSFSGSPNIRKDSVATFSTTGEINGGFVYSLKSWDGVSVDSEGKKIYQSSCPNDAQTITFATQTKELFKGSDGLYSEWNKIVDHLASKNWGCSPARV